MKPLDSAVKNAMAKFEALITVQSQFNEHQRSCLRMIGCHECIAAHARWKLAKETYILAIREMIG